MTNLGITFNPESVQYLFHHLSTEIGDKYRIAELSKTIYTEQIGMEGL